MVQAESYRKNPANFQSVFPKDDFWAIWEGQWDAQMLELLEESIHVFLFFQHNGVFGWYDFSHLQVV